MAIRGPQVLDMVTDRLATAGLLAVLGMLYPRSYMVFLALMFLDIFSHWFQMYSTFISGSETHKVRPRLRPNVACRIAARGRVFMDFAFFICCR